MKKRINNGLPVKFFVFDKTSEIEPQLLPKKGIWLRVIGLKDVKMLEKICSHYQIHDLVLEDILNPNHQPKYDRYDDYSLIILKTFTHSGGEDELRLLSMNIVVSREFILTFEDSANTIINNYVKRSANNPRTVITTAYDLLDSIIYHYLVFANAYQERVYEIEDTILESQGDYNFSRLFDLRRELHFFRRMVHPVQNMMIMFLSKQDSHIHSQEMTPYYNDLLDHVNRANNYADSFWESLNTLQAEIFTQLQYKLSRTMNFMTALSLIFLPLMVITGIYGMNFEFMPELRLKYAYPIVLLSMVFVGLGTFLLFVKRKLF